MFLTFHLQWHSQVIDIARAQHEHTVLLKTILCKVQKQLVWVGGTYPSVPYLGYAIGDMPC